MFTRILLLSSTLVPQICVHNLKDKIWDISKQLITALTSEFAGVKSPDIDKKIYIYVKIM